MKNNVGKILIASLTKERPHATINIFLSFLDNAKLLVEGNGVIHVAGFFEPEQNGNEIDPEDFEDENEDEEDEEDEEVEKKGIKAVKAAPEGKVTTPQPKVKSPQPQVQTTPKSPQLQATPKSPQQQPFF